MKQVLGIIGSPRKLGNCEIMAKEISNQLSISHELNLLRLQDFKILPCRGCYQCLFTKEHCVLDDDLNTVIQAMVDADAYIVSAPTYFLGINASLKTFLDRGISFYAHIENLWSKPAVGVAIAGIEGKEGYSRLIIQSFLKMIFADDKNTKVVYGALPGEIFLNKENKQAAGKLALALFGPRAEKRGPCCPQCGGDTFRFLDNNRVRCMLCSNSGIITMPSGSPTFEITKSHHDFFSSKEDALKHKEWLLGMKSRFIEHKKALKEITLPYLKQGSWIKPLEKKIEKRK
ncbi:MAG: flavodoxin family protein [Desulfobacteraceae bacterium]|nr:flavodoxin family protein [Desulfobacteraceae bacterium]